MLILSRLCGQAAGGSESFDDFASFRSGAMNAYFEKVFHLVGSGFKMSPALEGCTDVDLRTQIQRCFRNPSAHVVRNYPSTHTLSGT